MGSEVQILQIQIILKINVCCNFNFFPPYCMHSVVTTLVSI